MDIDFKIVLLFLLPVILVSGCSATGNFPASVEPDSANADIVSVATTPYENNTHESGPEDCAKDGGYWCNEDCYSECPIGQAIVCPASGDAYCKYRGEPKKGKYVIMTFFDVGTGEMIEGEVSINGNPVGIAEDGVFYLFEDTYLNMTDDWRREGVYSDDEEWDYYCIMYDAGLYGKDFEGEKDYSCFSFEYYDYDFDSHETIDNACEFDESFVYHLNEDRGFVQPESVRRFLDNLAIKGDVDSDLELIHMEVAGSIIYGSDFTYRGRDMADSWQWQAPSNTLKSHHGNCIDYSLAMISMIRLYNSSLDCYVMLIPEHAFPFCHLGDRLRIYEQGGVYVGRTLRGNKPEKEIREDIEDFLRVYSKKTYTSSDEMIIEGIFNDVEYHSFIDYTADNGKFIDWAVEKWKDSTHKKRALR